MSTRIVGADIGGTFTDLVLLDESGQVWVDKRLSTTDDLSAAVIDGVQALVDACRGAVGDIDCVVHGTTVATNAILERQGARTALITTQGFRDVLEIGRLRVPRLYDITWEKPAPLCPRRFRFEVRERMGADGRVVLPLDEDSVRDVVSGLARENIESVAVCLINAYVNPAHEQRLGELLREAMPGLHVSLSSEVLPEIKEFERTSTTVADAYVKPRMRRYLARLQSRLQAAGVRGPIYIMQSNGGIQEIGETAERPVYAIESGPAAGVIAAQALAHRLAVPNALTFDMGGTTAKISIVEDGRLSYSSEFEVGGEISRNSRLVKGSGYILRTPVIDIAEVGAGGGSIAWIDAGGGLHVGPRGAGARPGPVCYGRGGIEPTVTDANVILGYINPRGLGDGTVRIDREGAWRAVEARIATPLGVDVLNAAYGIHAIANATMARAVRAVTTERGRDVRGYVLVAFGGSGPVHAAALARDFEIPQVVVPPHPGLFSAFGLLFADVSRHVVRTVPGSSVVLSDGVLAQFPDLERQILLAADGAAAAAAVEWYADLRYRGQGHELRIPIYRGDPAGVVADRFAAEHAALFGHDKPGTAVEVVNLRLIVRTKNRWAGLQSRLASRAAGRGPGAGSSRRACHFGPGLGTVPTPVIASRTEMGSEPVEGPLIIEEYDATIVVPPDFRARRDELDNLWIERIR